MADNRVCPVKHAGALDNMFRRWLQNPTKILQPFIKEGMTVVDLGCGPGFFTVDMAKMVGKSGKVIASDLQEGMLEKVRGKTRGTELEKRITFHKCAENIIGITEQVDFILAFYMVHELPDQNAFFQEVKTLLKPNGQLLVVEPPFHVSKKSFNTTIEKAKNAGLTPKQGPNVLFSKTVLLAKIS